MMNFGTTEEKQGITGLDDDKTKNFSEDYLSENSQIIVGGERMKEFEQISRRARARDLDKNTCAHLKVV